MSDLPDLDLGPRKPDLKKLRRDVPDETVESNARRIGEDWGAATIKAPVERTELASLRVEIPKYVDRALALASAERSVTKQFLVLEALQGKGYLVEDEDLIEDKRKRRR